MKREIYIIPWALAQSAKGRPVDAIEEQTKRLYHMNIQALMAWMWTEGELWGNFPEIR